MKKGEKSKQLLIRCAAELFWTNGYSATGISEILNQAQLPKGSFYFYFKSKDELAKEVITYYQHLLLEQFQMLSVGKDWTSFVNAVFDYLVSQVKEQSFSGCPFAVVGMETALSKPEIAKTYMNALTEFQKLFYQVLIQSKLPAMHAELLSKRLLAVYQGNLMFGRISGNLSYLESARKELLSIYKEYRTLYQI